MGDENYWEPEIVKFEEQDKRTPPPRHAIVFTGSSTIGLWSTLATDFPNVPALNRGFGGSQMTDVVYFAHRIVIPYRPRQVIVYSGDNDLASGKTPEVVAGDFAALVARVHAALPGTPLLCIGVKPSPARWNLAAAMRATNALLRQVAARNRGVAYVDLFEAMLGADGTPRPELYCPDLLHMSSAGYALWTQILRPLLVTS